MERKQLKQFLMRKLQSKLTKKKIQFQQVAFINIKNVFFLLLFAITITGCDTYSNSELVNRVAMYRSENQEQLDKLVTMYDSISPDSCNMYYIQYSSSTDFFRFLRVPYDSTSGEARLGGDIDLNEATKNFIRTTLPHNSATTMTFAKKIYTTWELYKNRNHAGDYAKLVHFEDKRIFKLLFAHLKFYEAGNKQNINAEKDWCYFYDDHWAVMIGDPFFQKTQYNCLLELKH